VGFEKESCEDLASDDRNVERGCEWTLLDWDEGKGRRQLRTPLW